MEVTEIVNKYETTIVKLAPPPKKKTTKQKDPKKTIDPRPLSRANKI